MVDIGHFQKQQDAVEDGMDMDRTTLLVLFACMDSGLLLKG